MRPHWGINSTTSTLFRQNDVVQPLAHAMQALELERPEIAAHRPGHVQNGGDGMGVVGGELWIDAIRHTQ